MVFCKVHDFFLNLLKQTKLRMSVIKRGSHIWLIVFVALIILQCEGRERFYRPDLPEQLCAIGLIDIDDTLSYNICNNPFWPGGACSTCWVDSLVSTKKIFFEKSYQTEYSDGSDLFREFKFKISDEGKDLFVYNTDQPVINPFIEIPADLKFESGQKYFVHAGERDVQDISAECTVPDMPPEPCLVSLRTGINTLDLPREGCYFYGDGTLPYEPEKYTTYTQRFAEIEFSFSNINPDSYYVFFLIGSPPEYTPLDIEYPPEYFPWDDGPGHFASNILNYQILETNTDGFIYPFKGGQTIQHFCLEYFSHSYGVGCMTDTLYSYFIDGSKIPGGTCTMKILAQWDNVKYIPSFVKYFQVRIMSLPKEAYLFYKSLYTYKMERDDPFGELININGNVVGGNGIIALCRSRDLIVNISQKGKMYDPFF